MTKDTRALPAVLTAFLALSAGFIALASFEFSIVAMQIDLGFSSDSANGAVLVPSAAALSVVFLAGSLADRLGSRKVMLAGVALFGFGAVLVTVAGNLAMLVAGRAFSGVGSSVMAIVGLAVVNSAYSDTSSRARVFAVYAAMVPAIFMVVPAGTAMIIDRFSWRAVSVVWLVLAGLLVFLAARYVPQNTSQGSSEVLTPLLCGFALAGIALGVTLLRTSQSAGRLALLVGLLCTVALVVLLRKWPHASLDLRVLRTRGAPILMVGLIVAAMPNTFFFTNLLLQYRYEKSLLAIALLMVIPQALAVAGGLLSAPVNERIGPLATSVLALSLAGLTSLAALFVTPSAPIWVPVAALAVAALPIAAAVGPLTEVLMNLAPSDGSAAASSLSKSLSSLGSTIGGTMLGAIGFAAFQRDLTQELSTTTSPEQAAAIAEAVRNGVVVAQLVDTPAVTDEATREMLVGAATGLLHAQSAGFAVLGIATAVVYFAAAAMLVVYGRVRSAPSHAA